MAKFALDDGEREIQRERVQVLNSRRSLVPADLIVTDRRVVLAFALQGSPSKLLVPALWLGALVRSAAQAGRITHEIARTELGSAEATDATTLVVRSKGEGYGMIWFEVTTGAADALAKRLHWWGAGRPDPSPLPTATVIKR